MKATATYGEDHGPWRFREALREVAGFTDEEIEGLFAATDHLDLVELGMALEEGYGIEILDEDLLIPPDNLTSGP